METFVSDLLLSVQKIEKIEQDEESDPAGPYNGKSFGQCQKRRISD
jgi:hypothetical protein